MDDDPIRWFWRWGFFLHDDGWMLVNRRRVIIAEGRWPAYCKPRK